MDSLSERMVAELEQLNRRQRLAATVPGNVVVRAGPGSGKTRTLVARAGYLLQTEVSRFRGVACITYTNAAAGEVRHRLRQLGVVTEQRLTCSTLHAFCLNEVLRAYAPLTGEWLPAAGEVLDEVAAIGLLQRCFDDLGIPDLQARYRLATNTRIRRALACGENTDSFDPREVSAAHLYDRKLIATHAIDFEAMVIRALNVVRNHQAVRDLMRARFPHLIVDEYQDLGGVLHQLVVALHDRAEITVSAVGDADQSVFGFTGADPRYIEELASRPDFAPVELEVNYRSGQLIVDASEAVLGRRGRHRRAAAGLAAGSVRITPIDGGLDRHAAEVVAIVERRLTEGVPLEKIAVLYPRRGPMLTALLKEFDRAAFPVLFEKDDLLPAGTLSRFVQRCASRAVLLSQARAASVSQTNAGSAALHRSEAPDLFSLERDLVRLRREAGLALEPGRLTVLRSLQRDLDPAPSLALDSPAAPWLARLIATLDLAVLSAQHPDQQNTFALGTLADACEQYGLVLEDLAAAVEVLGKVVLTNYHTAKGREFNTVILPGLVNGVMPADVFQNGSWSPPTGPELAEQRRTFFVAVSRAQVELHCLVGRGFRTPYGRWIDRGPSDFVVQMEQTRHS